MVSKYFARAVDVRLDQSCEWLSAPFKRLANIFSEVLTAQRNERCNGGGTDDIAEPANTKGQPLQRKRAATVNIASSESDQTTPLTALSLEATSGESDESSAALVSCNPYTPAIPTSTVTCRRAPRALEIPGSPRNILNCLRTHTQRPMISKT